MASNLHCEESDPGHCSEPFNTNPVWVTESLIKDLYQAQSLGNVIEGKLDNIKAIITTQEYKVTDCNQIL